MKDYIARLNEVSQEVADLASRVPAFAGVRRTAQAAMDVYPDSLHELREQVVDIGSRLPAFDRGLLAGIDRISSEFLGIYQAAVLGSDRRTAVLQRELPQATLREFGDLKRKYGPVMAGVVLHRRYIAKRAVSIAALSARHFWMLAAPGSDPTEESPDIRIDPPPRHSPPTAEIRPLAPPAAVSI